MKQGLSYLRSKGPFIFAGLLLELCFVCVGSLAELSGDLILFLVFLIAAGFIVPLALEWTRTKGFYATLLEMEKSEDSYETLQALLSQRHQDPLHSNASAFLLEESSLRAKPALSYPENRTQDALIALERDAKRHIAEVAKDAYDYRDYIETWSHEIKTPLAAATLMASADAPVNKEELLEELQRIYAYVEQALFFARSYDVNKDYVLAPHKVDKLINESLASRKNILIARNATIEKKIDPVGLSIICDAKWIVFALGQMIDNACKYSLGDKVELSFRAQTINKDKADESVLLSIRDHGVGVPSYDIERVFDKGYVGQNGREGSQHKATGMGLYLVSKIAERQGFRVELTSQSSQEYDQSFTQIDLIFPQEQSRIMPLEDVSS